MNAIGLYYLSNYKVEKEDINKLGADPQIVDLHINIWKVEKGKIFLDPEIYIDFGIMSSFKVEKLCLYLPFGIETIIDLGKSLNNKKKELCAIFNDELLPEPQKNGCYCKIHYIESPDTEDFFLYELGEANIKTEFQKDNKKETTYVTIDLKGNPEDKDDNDSYKSQKRYIRFRVKVKKRQEISITSHISNDLLQAAFSMSDYYDIRVNEKREIPDKVKEDMLSKNFRICKFTKVHLFYMADSREGIENESSLKCDSRLLESCQWRNYEPKTKIYNPIFIAHHWKKRIKEEDKKPISSFSVFFNTIYPKLSVFRLISYVAVVVLLGCCGSMLSDSDIRFWIIIILIGFVLIYLAYTKIFIKCPKIYRKR